MLQSSQRHDKLRMWFLKVDLTSASHRVYPLRLRDYHLTKLTNKEMLIRSANAVRGSTFTPYTENFACGVVLLSFFGHL
jgi:hypothetical protein